jgi:hypothetical protein
VAWPTPPDLDDDGTPTGAAAGAALRCPECSKPHASGAPNSGQGHARPAALGRCHGGGQGVPNFAAAQRWSRKHVSPKARISNCRFLDSAVVRRCRTVRFRGACRAPLHAACCMLQQRRRSVGADGPARAGERGNVLCRKSGLHGHSPARAQPGAPGQGALRTRLATGTMLPPVRPCPPSTRRHAAHGGDDGSRCLPDGCRPPPDAPASARGRDLAAVSPTVPLTAPRESERDAQ